ncbi:RagB/SusD family nutrient uptake outer membrane protein [Bacteroides neonati]|uniref:RagB/SusD family nutrient uptake outer membrane protein n=1 Tax=Bacteroides neonati TaxID=1347393 RepID=UPI0005AA01FC|nr:RagB/SusD family nutrient uptake outer membrane protein [Bacteroides neonati]
MKRLIYLLISVVLTTSCSDFLNTAPKDALSPATTWKTEADANSFAIGCYQDWIDGEKLLYQDCGSDIGYNQFPWEEWNPIGNGTLTASATGANFYDFTTIRRCNTFVENVQPIPFSNEADKLDLIAQVRALRAYKYFELNFWYGGVPIIDTYTTAEEAKVPRNTEAEVKAYIYKELDELIPNLKEMPSQKGRIARGTALAIKMRSALYWGDYQRAMEAAQAIMNMHKYELDKDYTNLFTIKGQSSNEIIYAIPYAENIAYNEIVGRMYNNADGGWSSITPTQNLVDMYEMNDGTPREESPLYDAVHPFSNRDPRMEMTILFPGQVWQSKILNTLDKEVNGKENPNYPLVADNASKTSLSWAKYLAPLEQYPNMWQTATSPILFRYAEVLLSFAEASNELKGPSDNVYKVLDEIRLRVGMPAVNRSKYGTKETLRELIRRERTIELAGEGLRRADILRWKDNNGKMIAETVLNKVLYRVIGSIDYTQTDPHKRAVIDVNASAETRKLETRQFIPENRYLPIPQSSIDKNPKLEQNKGY